MNRPSSRNSEYLAVLARVLVVACITGLALFFIAEPELLASISTAPTAAVADSGSTKSKPVNGIEQQQEDDPTEQEASSSEQWMEACRTRWLLTLAISGLSAFLFIYLAHEGRYGQSHSHFVAWACHAIAPIATGIIGYLNSEPRLAEGGRAALLWSVVPMAVQYWISTAVDHQGWGVPGSESLQRWLDLGQSRPVRGKRSPGLK